MEYNHLIRTQGSLWAMNHIHLSPDFYHLINDLDHPAWVKVSLGDTEWPVMKAINALYPIWYNGTEDYVGKTDAEKWGFQVGSHYRLFDFEAMTNPGTIIEAVEPTPQGKTEYCLSRKLAIWYEPEERFLIFGEANAYPGVDSDREDRRGSGSPLDGDDWLVQIQRCPETAILRQGRRAAKA